MATFNDQETLARAHGAGHVVVGFVDARDAGPGQHVTGNPVASATRNVLAL